jgi:cyclic pyranopterin phosphate synthase
MLDGCGREIDHLRLSLTNLCDLACRYCTRTSVRHDGRMINRRFALAVVRWLSGRHGIRHIRLTGGEPLLYPELDLLVRRLGELTFLDEITLTTNGQLLAREAQVLRDAGVSRVNVSLDTLSAVRFSELTRGGDLGRTLSGIEAAVEVGLTPVRVNVIVQRGLNEDEVADLAEWGLARGCAVRFLEVMPIGVVARSAARLLVPTAEVLERLGERFDLQPLLHRPGQPARDYAAAGAGLRGVVGVISHMTEPFCSSCRRLRITCTGTIVPCLCDTARFDLVECWDGQRLDVVRADRLLQEAVSGKPAEGNSVQPLSMASLGG